MPDIETTPAIVVRTVDYGDKDIIVTLYGRDTGKLGAIAKNARASTRRFGGGLQPMRVVRAHLARRPNRDLARLDSIDVIEDFPDIEGHFDRIAAGSYATELLRETSVELDADPVVFHLAVRLFRRLADIETPREIERLVHQFEYQLLRRQGTPPAVQTCFRCGRPATEMEKVHAMRNGKGIVCADCRRTGEETGVLAPSTVALLRFYAGHLDDWPHDPPEPAAIEQARRFMTAALRRILDSPLNSRSSIEALFQTVDST